MSRDKIEQAYLQQKATAVLIAAVFQTVKNLFRGSMKGPQPLHVQSAAGGAYGGEGRIPPLPVIDEGGRRPNEAQSTASGSGAVRQCRIVRFKRILLPISIYDRKNRVFSIIQC